MTVMAPPSIPHLLRPAPRPQRTGAERISQEAAQQLPERLTATLARILATDDLEQLYADETGQPAPEGMGDAWIREELLAQNAQGLDRAAKVVASAVTPPNSTLVGDALAHAALQYLRLRLPGDRTLEALDDMLVVHFNRRIEPNLPLLLRKTNLVELQVLALLAALAVTKKIALAGGAGVEARLAGLQQELYRALAHYRGSICGAARLAVVLCLALKVLGTAVKGAAAAARQVLDEPDAARPFNAQLLTELKTQLVELFDVSFVNSQDAAAITERAIRLAKASIDTVLRKALAFGARVNGAIASAQAALDADFPELVRKASRMLCAVEADALLVTGLMRITAVVPAPTGQGQAQGQEGQGSGGAMPEDDVAAIWQLTNRIFVFGGEGPGQQAGSMGALALFPLSMPRVLEWAVRLPANVTLNQQVRGDIPRGLDPWAAGLLGSQMAAWAGALTSTSKLLGTAGSGRGYVEVSAPLLYVGALSLAWVAFPMRSVLREEILRVRHLTTGAQAGQAGQAGQNK